MVEFMKKNPELDGGFEYYEMSREEKMERWWKINHEMMKDDQAHRNFTKNSKHTNY